MFAQSWTVLSGWVTSGSSQTVGLKNKQVNVDGGQEKAAKQSATQSLLGLTFCWKEDS